VPAWTPGLLPEPLPGEESYGHQFFSFYVYISHSNKRLRVTIGDNIWENCLNDLKKNEGLQRRRT
jgi:hypothetical protein